MLHVGDNMELFGPVHAYSAPFFERYINFFHRINTNKKLGELESTFMQVSARACNLRAMLSDDTDLQDTVSDMVATIEATEREDARGYQLATLLDHSAQDYNIDVNATPIELSEWSMQQLRGIIPNTTCISKQALAVHRISGRGVTYGTLTWSNFKNSNILFRLTQGHEEETLAGSILDIFQHTHETVPGSSSATFYLTVRQLQPAVAISDPFKEFGFAAGFLCIDLPGPLYVIKLAQIISHIAVTRIEDGDYAGLLHVLPVDRE
ncbi:hypothetical protein DXG01_007577 [Tephrocybe rancida]|nr:hypothetical protein DXG01_007577 [Tephrocybe rancida]